MVSRFHSPLPFRSKNTELMPPAYFTPGLCQKDNKKLKSFRFTYTWNS